MDGKGLRISATGVPVKYARDVAAPLTLCTLNFEVSIPSDCNTDMIHLAIVLDDTGLYGLMRDKNNLATKCPLRNLSVSEREMYSFSAASGQIEAQPGDEKVISIDYPGLEVFNRSLKTMVIESCDSFRKFGSKRDSVCCLCAEANAQSITVLRGSVPKNGPIDCASKNHFSLNSADGKGLVPKY